MIKMMEQSKTSLRLPDRKNELLTTPMKLQTTSKKSSFGISRTTAEANIVRQTPPEFKNCFGDGSNPGQELGNEGVEKFMYQVSNYIESYSDKDKKSGDRSQKNVNSASLKSNSSAKHRIKESVTTEEDRYYMKNLKLIQPVARRPERSPQNKKKIINNPRKRDQNDKNRQIKTISTDYKRNELSGVGNKKRTPVGDEKPKETTNKNETKRRKPSEIPLRKTRTDSERKPKPVSLLLTKPLKEVESSSSIDFYTNKPFSPIDEVSLCSELQITINAVSSSERLSSSDTPVNSERPATRENIFNIRLERCFNNLNIPVVSEFTSSETLEEKLPVGKKSKFLDLEKVKTSSFTVLPSNAATLDRLESLHKQNVLSKNKVNSVNSKKSKPLTPKQFFNSIKRRTSRKSLPHRLACAKNKSNVRIKIKKSKKEIEENAILPEKFLQPEMNATHLKAFKEVLDARKMNSSTWGTGSDTSQVSKQIPSVQEEEEKEIKTVKGKSVKQKKQNSKQKEDSKIPTIQKYPPQEVENSAKVTPATNKIKVVNVVRKTAPAPPSGVPDQTQTIQKNPVNEQKEDTEKNVNVNEKEFIPVLPKKVTKPPTVGKPERKTTTEKFKDKKSLVIRGMALNFGKNETPKVQERKKTKAELKIDLNIQETPEESCKTMQSCDWLYKSDQKPQKEKLSKQEKDVPSPDSISIEWAQEMENKSESSRNLNKPDSNILEPRKDGSLLKERLFDNITNLRTKKMRKKMRSDSGDKPLPSFTPFLGSDMSFQNKVKVGTKLRNSLTKPNNMEEQREMFEEETPLKIRRRNSEPISLSGFIWKKANFAVFRGHKPSVSSLASSLKHLNTDDFDDFIFWEPLPQKMTSSWEMSLYQFKKHWSVLSCSVFRDNRLSNTPGLILENLRNGGNPNTRQSARSQNERINRVKENLFDVEPSIAQKNIDIRNWLAALNFPTANTNSTDGINEGSFTSQFILDSQNITKTQVTPKRRKTFRNINLLDKTSEIITKDKSHLIGWEVKEEENLRDLVRRKSGGFVLSEHSTHRFNLESKSAEEKSIPREENDRNCVFYPKELENVEYSAEPETAELGTTVDETLHRSRFNFDTILKLSKFLSPDINIWKYLFMFTLFIICLFFYFGSVIQHS